MTQIEQTQKKPVVALGMSGGVDSSVAVHLLQKAGYEVHGIHMLMIPERFQPNPTSQNDAKAVAEQFGIKFTVLDVRGKFEENPFVKEVLRHIEVKTALGEELINRIQHLG